MLPGSVKTIPWPCNTRAGRRGARAGRADSAGTSQERQEASVAGRRFAWVGIFLVVF